jgi:hypothetical protein
MKATKEREKRVEEEHVKLSPVEFQLAFPLVL